MSTTDQPNSPDIEPTQPALELGAREPQRQPLGAEPAPKMRSLGLDLASPDDGPLALVPTRGELAVVQRAADALELSAESVRPARRRRVRLPVILFVATCLSTFWVGANHWLPLPFGSSVRQMLIAHWADGLIYMACLLGILLTHEMGHFLATVRYRIPASLPVFHPVPHFAHWHDGSRDWHGWLAGQSSRDV